LNKKTNCESLIEPLVSGLIVSGLQMAMGFSGFSNLDFVHSSSRQQTSGEALCVPQSIP